MKVYPSLNWWKHTTILNIPTWLFGITVAALALVGGVRWYVNWRIPKSYVATVTLAMEATQTFEASDTKQVCQEEVLGQAADTLGLETRWARPRASVIAELSRNLDVTLQPDSHFIKIEYAGKTPEAAKEIAKAVALAYQEKKHAHLQSAAEETLKSLDEEMRAQKARVAALEARLGALRDEPHP